MMDIKPGVLFFIFAFLLVYGLDQAGAKNIYVSAMIGSDDNPGSSVLPYKTIGKAMGLIKAGDTCFILEGTYREEVQGLFLRGKSDSPIVIQAYPGHEVIIDGTIDIKSEWEVYSGNIYKTTLDTIIWQLFVGEDMMTSARWPNLEVFSENTWNRKSWSKMHPNSTLGGMVDDPSWNPGNTLAGQQLSFEGAMAVLNLNYWTTGVSRVDSHQAGSGYFQYDPAGVMQNDDMFGVFDELYGSYYYIEGSLACLDAPGEWYFNPETRELYLWAKNGVDPSGLVIRGKTQTYALEFLSSTHVQVKGLSFFASTLSFRNCFYASIEDCVFHYPSYSRRMLGSKSSIKVTQFLNAGAESLTYHRIRNCEFAYTDGSALNIMGRGNIIENCLFHDIDFSCHGSWSAGTISSWYTQEMIFRNNTIYAGGNSETVACGAKSFIEMNEVWQCGMLQGDGAIFQFTPNHFNGSIVRKNWVHDTEKRGIRLDDGGPDGIVGTNAKIDHNVAWNCKYQGIQGKGDFLRFFNNLSFDNQSVDFNLVDQRTGRIYNRSTISVNNISGNVSANENNPDNILLGETQANWIETKSSQAIEWQLRDIRNRDFRLRPESFLVDGGIQHPGIPQADYRGPSIDIGPYEFSDTAYWIPGRKLYQASHPIPADGGISHYEFVDLIWREGYKAESHDIYFGQDSLGISVAERDSPYFKSNQESNIFNPGILYKGENYFWRIDAINARDVKRGGVWSFTAGENANPTVYQVDSKVYGISDGIVSFLDSATISLGNRKTTTNEEGESSLHMVREGKYILSVSRKGFKAILDTVLISSDTLFRDTLNSTTYSLTFRLKDKDTGDPIDEALIMFDGSEMITDSLGMARQENVEYKWYAVSASAEGYQQMIDWSFEIFSDTILLLYLEKEYVQLNLKVSDRATGEPVYRAKITYADQLIVSNNNGEVILEKLTPGKSWVLGISHDDYFSFSDTLSLLENTSLEIQLSPVLADIIFNIHSSEGAIAGVLISLDNSLSQETDNVGEAMFLNRPSRQSHYYTISKDGYKQILDSLFLESDTTIHITLDPSSDLANSFTGKVEVYPNPFRNRLFIDSELDHSVVRLINGEGKVVATQLLIYGSNSMDMSKQAAGVYHLSIGSSGKQTISGLVKLE